MGLTKESTEAIAIRLSLEHAARRWPHANRVTMPQLMEDIEEAKRRLAKIARRSDRTGHDK